MKNWSVFIFIPFYLSIQDCNKSVLVLTNAIDAIVDTTAITLKDNFETVNSNWEIGYGTWQIRTDGSAGKVFSHTSDETFGVALLKTNAFNDVDVQVKFRPVSGNSDQAGGIIFRAADKNNYYLVRANGLEGNFGFYKSVNGSREEIKSVNAVAPAKNQWHTLRVIAKGDHIQAFLEDKLLLDTHTSFYSSGFVGLWTKADSQTDFDDFVLKGVKK